MHGGAVTLLEYTLLTGGALAGVLALILGFTWLWSWLGSRLWVPEGADAAVRFVAVHYGIPVDKLPRIYWQKDDPKCPFAEPGYFDPTRGAWVAGNWAVGALTIAHREGFPFAEGALPVEMLNEADYRATGRIWSNREYTPEFQARVEACRNEMRKRAL